MSDYGCEFSDGIAKDIKEAVEHLKAQSVALEQFFAAAQTGDSPAVAEAIYSHMRTSTKAQLSMMAVITQLADTRI